MELQTLGFTSGDSRTNAGAVEALRSILGEELFWSPAGVGQLPSAAQGDYLKTQMRTRKHRILLGQVTESLSLPVWQRIERIRHLLRGLYDPDYPRQALAFAGGLPRQILDAVDKGGLDLSYRKGGLWLPGGLRVFGRLGMTGSRLLLPFPDGLEVSGDCFMARMEMHGGGHLKLPRSFVVGGNLSISGTGVSEIPSELFVGGEFRIGSTPLEELTDAEIRSRAEIRGEIRR